MAAKPTVYISKIKFSGKQEVLIDRNDKILIVGSNNSGKSQSLREIFEISNTGESNRCICVKEVDIVKSGKSEDLKSYLEYNGIFRENRFILGSWSISEQHISMWTSSHLRGNIINGFFNNINAENRLKICDQAQSRRKDEYKENPQQVLYDNRKLTEKVSNLFKSAFGKGLLIDYRGGSVIPIHVGDEPDWKITDRISDEYVRYVREHPELYKQGDGVRSYAGILLESIVNDYSITMIDEPEAFLHPPQMRRLGETLATEVKGQLLVATHSSDILRGFLEGAKGKVRILRIRRDGDVNLISEPPKNAISELWEKPSLRYSNALEGIFHEQTIICEDDSDCRLINSVADHLATSNEKLRIDTAYVPTGGKAAIPKTASVLRRIGVPVKAVFDIDFLSDKTLVRSAIEAFGGTWGDIEHHWVRVDAAVRKGNKPKTSLEIGEDIKQIINDMDTDDLPRQKIVSAMKQNSSWNLVKSFGESAIPKGEIRSEYRSLVSKLQNVGIYIVPVGEIENFCPDIGGHGPKFVTNLLSSLPLGSPELNSLREFVKLVQAGPSGRLD
jgi:hypothetical protein